MKNKPKPPFFARWGEDRICRKLFKRIGVRSKCAVEFGALDGEWKSNTRYFRESLGWRCIWLDLTPLSPEVSYAHITPESVNEVFRQFGVPLTVDLVSIDIDGNDLWVWKAMEYRPSLVVIEYNPKFNGGRSLTVPYDPSRIEWDRTDYYGASANALVRVGKEKGYILAGTTPSNLIFALKGSGAAEVSVHNVRKRKYLKHVDPLNRPWMPYP